jgi:hypothetical protein
MEYITTESYAYSENRREDLVNALHELVRYATGNRGSKEGNPYGKKEIENALRVLAKERGFNDIDRTWYDGADEKYTRR